jgi:hypothetical protein
MVFNKSYNKQIKVIIVNHRDRIKPKKICKRKNNKTNFNYKIRTNKFTQMICLIKLLKKTMIIIRSFW